MNLEKYNNAYKNAVELLKQMVSFFEVHPKYFLHLLKKENENLYLDFQEKELFQILNENKTKCVEVVERYLNILDVVTKNAHKISNIKNYNDPLEFIQFVMENISLVDLVYNYKDINELETYLKEFKQQ